MIVFPLFFCNPTKSYFWKKFWTFLSSILKSTNIFLSKIKQFSSSAVYTFLQKIQNCKESELENELALLKHQIFESVMICLFFTKTKKFQRSFSMKKSFSFFCVTFRIQTVIYPFDVDCQKKFIVANSDFLLFFHIVRCFGRNTPSFMPFTKIEWQTRPNAQKGRLLDHSKCPQRIFK